MLISCSQVILFYLPSKELQVFALKISYNTFRKTNPRPDWEPQLDQFIEIVKFSFSFQSGSELLDLEENLQICRMSSLRPKMFIWIHKLKFTHCIVLVSTTIWAKRAKIVIGSARNCQTSHKSTRFEIEWNRAGLERKYSY